LTLRAYAVTVSEKMPKTAQLQIRVTPAEKAALRRAARRAGMDTSAYVLSRALSEPSARFQAAVRACGIPGSERLALAELGMLLATWTAPELRAAVASPAADGLPAWVAAYVASLVELACDRKGERPPAWTEEALPLPTPLFGSSLLSLRVHLLIRSPPPFRRRNIFIDASLGDRA
jgi:hypothetical protein